MPTWAIIVLAVLGAFFVLALLGALAASAAQQPSPRAVRLESSTRSTARWPTRAPATGAGSAAPSRPPRGGRSRPSAPARRSDELTLVQVVDRPGTEDDKAVFRVVAGDVRVRLTLGRVQGEWVGEAAEGG